MLTAIKFLAELLIVLAFIVMVLAWVYLLGYSVDNLYNIAEQ
jgi:hypothetical protein